MPFSIADGDVEVGDHIWETQNNSIPKEVVLISPYRGTALLFQVKRLELREFITRQELTRSGKELFKSEAAALRYLHGRVTHFTSVQTRQVILNERKLESIESRLKELGEELNGRERTQEATSRLPSVQDLERVRAAELSAYRSVPPKD